MPQPPAAYTRLRDAVRKTLLEGQRLIMDTDRFDLPLFYDAGL